MIPRIRDAIKRAGLEELPDDPSQNLVDFGFDSLMAVMTVSELEKEFKIKIRAASIEDQTFESLNTLQAFLQKLGAI
ncbi:acyl carrier protein [Bdellovibrionota bacterium FG-2]